jgi:hypothetical protein
VSEPTPLSPSTPPPPAASDRSAPLELEEPSGSFNSAASAADHRPHMPEPLPVRLIAVEDVRLPAPHDVDVAALDAFYIALLQFQRAASSDAAEGLTYNAENVSLHFDLLDGSIVHESLRPLGVEVLSLPETEKKIIAAELEYTRQRGTTPGVETLLLLDPAGNWVEIGQVRLIA